MIKRIVWWLNDYYEFRWYRRFIFTPIINYPEVAILGVGRSEKKQIFINGKFQTRTMLPISLSYDHRIIDGAEAARFNNDLKENLGKNFAYKLAV